MKLPAAPVAVLVLGGVVALGALAIPMSVLENWVMDSGVPAVIAAAEPPLGFTARAVVALASGGLVALLALLGLPALLGRGGSADAAADTVPMPVLRRADAHPDAPPRPPLLATRDLGTPFLEIRASGSEPAPADDSAATEVPEPAPAATVEALAPTAAAKLAEQPLPKDLDQPLAAFDPEAIPEVPIAPPVQPLLRARASRPPVFEPKERFEVYQLTPPPRRASQTRAVAPKRSEEAIARPETEASVHALLERLERGVVRKRLTAAPAARPRDAERGLEDALVSLRNLARHA